MVSERKIIMINKILRNQRYRGHRESLKFNSDLNETKVDLSINESIVVPLSETKDLARKNIEERQEDLPSQFAEESIIDGDIYSWEGLGEIKLRVRQATEQLKLYTRMLKGV